MRTTRSFVRSVALAALAVVLVPFAPTATAATATPGSGYNDWTCRPSQTHPEPVVLLHGLGSFQQQWTLQAPGIAKAGYCVFSLDYGANFTGLNGEAPVEQSGTEIAAFVDKVRTATGADKVDIVGHSLGGFMALWLPKETDAAGHVDRVVALAPPSHGTTLFGALTLIDGLGARSLLDTTLGTAGCQACVDLLAGGTAVGRLEDGGIAQPGVTYTVIATKHDEVVTPTSRAFIDEPGVRNYYIQDRCPLDPVGHFGIGFDLGTTSLILNGLDPSVPIKCGFGPPV